MRDVRAEDPADIVAAWEAVEELLAPVPEGPGKHVLRLVAAGAEPDEIAQRLDLALPEVHALAARGRVRILTASISSP
jgi:DNA-directed RNA polymerase specialized sigma24 family protein